VTGRDAVFNYKPAILNQLAVAFIKILNLFKEDQKECCALLDFLIVIVNHQSELLELLL